MLERIIKKVLLTKIPEVSVSIVNKIIMMKFSLKSGW